MLDRAEPVVAITRHQCIGRIALPVGHDGACPQVTPCALRHGAQSQIPSACSVGATALDQRVGFVPVDGEVPIARLTERRARRREIHPRVPVVPHHEGRAARANDAHAVKHEERPANVERRYAWVCTIEDIQEIEWAIPPAAAPEPRTDFGFSRLGCVSESGVTRHQPVERGARSRGADAVVGR